MQIDPRLRALNRFGLGARPGELSQIDPKGWLRAQVQPAAAINPDKSLLTTKAIIDALAAARNSTSSHTRSLQPQRHFVFGEFQRR